MVGLDEARRVRGLSRLGEIAIERFQPGQRHVIRYALLGLLQQAEVDRVRQGVGPGCIDQLAILEAHGEIDDAQDIAGQGLAVELQALDAPGIRVDRLDALV